MKLKTFSRSCDASVEDDHLVSPDNLDPILDEIISDFCSAGNPEIIFSSGGHSELFDPDNADVADADDHVNDNHNHNFDHNLDDEEMDKREGIVRLEKFPHDTDEPNVDLFLFEPELAQEPEVLEWKLENEKEEKTGNEMFENFETLPKSRSADPIYSGRCYCFLTSLSDRRCENDDDDVDVDAKELNVARSLDRLSSMTSRAKMEQPSLSPSPPSG